MILSLIYGCTRRESSCSAPRETEGMPVNFYASGFLCRMLQCFKRNKTKCYKLQQGVHLKYQAIFLIATCNGCFRLLGSICLHLRTAGCYSGGLWWGGGGGFVT